MGGSFSFHFHWGCICFDGERGKNNSWSKRHSNNGVGDIPTRANPGLLCNRINKKHESQHTQENLQEKDLNFTRKGTFLQINF